MSRLPLIVPAVVVAGGLYYIASPGPSKDVAMYQRFRLPTALRLTSVTRLTDEAKLFRFALPADAPAGFPVASITRPAEAWLPVIRPYTPVSTHDKPYLEFAIKQYPNGRSSGTFHNLKVGDSIYFAGPIKGPKVETLDTLGVKDVLLLAAGTGITPCMQMAQAVLARQSNGNPTVTAQEPNVTLVVGAQSTQDVILRVCIEELRARHPDRLRVIYRVGSGDAVQSADGPSVSVGRIDSAFLQDLTGLSKSGEAAAFVCGPQEFEDSMAGNKASQGVLQQLGYPKTHVFKF